MAQPTPGPWRCQPSGVYPSEFVITGSDSGGGAVLPILGRTCNWPNRAEANARLIAAAPEMLNALKASLAVLVSADPGKVPRLAERRALVEAAIAKAEAP